MASRRWFEVVTEDVLKQSPLFRDGDSVFLEQVIMALQAAAGRGAASTIITRGEIGPRAVPDRAGRGRGARRDGVVLKVLSDGDVFGEIGVLMSTPRNATVRAKIPTDLYVLAKADFARILRDNPNFATAIKTVAKERF